jgi:cell division protein WhiA
VTVQLDLSNAATARRAFALLREHEVRSELRTYRRRAFDGSTRYQLRVDAGETLLEAGVLSATRAPLERPPKRVIGRSCCRAAYLRGAMLGGGSLSGPRDPHLELRTATRAGAEFLAAVAARDELSLAVAERRTHAIAYAKGHDAIRDLLAAAGAGGVALRLEEYAVVAATRAHANRLANADEANLERTAAAAHRQLEAIRALGVDALPPELVEIAELRVRHPTASLRELAAKARPPLTKAAAHRRLNAIVDLVESG